MPWYLRCCLALLLAATAAACSVPVFAYALGNWPPANHILRLDAAGRAALAALGPQRAANLDAADAQTGGQAVEIEIAGSTWWRSGPEGLAIALDSPARQRLTAALVGGESLVWILVRSGTPRDAEVEAMLRKRLEQLQTSLELPPAEPGPPAFPDRPGPPLRLSFTIIPVDRADPAERGLVAQIEAQLREPTPGPLLAAVLGRGRMLDVLAGKTIDEANIEGMCLFACGPCSCQVKEANPGVDLLVAVDWDAELQRQAQPAPAAQPAPVAQPAPAPARPVSAPEVVRFEPLPAPPPAAPALPWWRTWIWSLAAGAVLLALILAVVLRRRR